jgi:hypothetical protein
MISTNGSDAMAVVGAVGTASATGAVATNMTRSFQEHVAFNRIRCECNEIAIRRNTFVLARFAERDIPDRHFVECPCFVGYVAWKAECQRLNALYRRVYALTRKDGSFVDNKTHESEELAWAYAVETFSDRDASKGPGGVRDWIYVSSFWERTGP